MLEKILFSHLLEHLFSNNLISSNQHGFLPRRSTITQLLGALNHWTSNYCNNNAVHTVYTDLSKAFDKVSHMKLLEVIKSYGIDGSVYTWLQNFLTGRIQQVTIQSTLSSPQPVTSGVPQGSVLGPLLFLMYIDDLSKLSSNTSHICLFADDTKIYSTNITDLNTKLEDLKTFFDSRQLSLASEKCEKLSLSKSDQHIIAKIGNSTLKNTTVVRDLGVFITHDLKWTHHIQNIKTKAMQRCYQILRSFNSRNIWTLLKSYITFVRPTLEYASEIWNSFLTKDIEAVEGVQRYFTKQICCRCNISFISYQHRLKMLNLRSLEYRRLQTDLIMVFKITHKLIDIPTENFFTFYSSPYATRSHKYCLLIPKTKAKCRSSFLTDRIPSIWNKLPSDMFLPDTLLSFKTKLNRFDLHRIASLKY